MDDTAGLLHQKDNKRMGKFSASGMYKLFITYGLILVTFILVGVLVPDKVDEFGPISIIPALFLVIYIFNTKRILEALILGTILALIMSHKLRFLTAANELLLGVLQNGKIVWLFIVCGLMGSIVTLLEKSGGAAAFRTFVEKKAKSQKSALLWTFMLAIFVCIDDYLNVLTVGSCMTKINDHHKIPREMLAYTVASTAAPACVLNPISTWGVFIAGLLEANAICGNGEGVLTYIKSIPFNFYAIAALTVEILVILGVIPIFGPMKEAFRRVREEGILAPPGSEKIDIRAGQSELEIPNNPKIYNFFLPIIMLIGSTIYFDLNMQMGVIVTMIFTFVLLVFQGIVDPQEFVDIAIDGMKNMLLPIIMVVLSFCFAEASEEIGFVTYVIEIASKYMTPNLLPLMIFLVFSVTEFVMGISWGMFIIAFPIVIPLTLKVGGDPILTVGAVCAAGVWGSHCCFYSDSTILTSAATGCDNFRHALTQLPYGLIAGSLAAVGYLIAGFLL